MKRTVVLVAGMLFSATAALSNPAFSEFSIPFVPSIPHGQDWSIFAFPLPEPHEELLPEEEAKRILPNVAALRPGNNIVFFTTRLPASEISSAVAFSGILVGIALLFAAYELIPPLPIGRPSFAGTASPPRSSCLDKTDRYTIS